jgi:alpha-1,2-glucosyltransferase
LYILSYLLRPLFGSGVAGLRATNVVCTLLLAWVIYAIYARRVSNEQKAKGTWLPQHNALNIVLFPPLFFFSALYYTDVASTLAVVVFWLEFTSPGSKGRPLWQRNARLASLGAVALLFRQTNIFWVAVFPAGLVLVKELDQGHLVVKQSMYRRAAGFGDTWVNVAKTSWKMEVVYDPPIGNASIEGMSTSDRIPYKSRLTYSPQTWRSAS